MVRANKTKYKLKTREAGNVSAEGAQMLSLFCYFSRGLGAWLAMGNYFWGSQSNVCPARCSSLPTSKSSGIDVIGTSFEAVTPSMFEEEAKLLFPADVSVGRWRRKNSTSALLLLSLSVVVVVIYSTKYPPYFLLFNWRLLWGTRRSVRSGSCFLPGLVLDLAVTFLLLSDFIPWRRRITAHLSISNGGREASKRTQPWFAAWKHKRGCRCFANLLTAP